MTVEYKLSGFDELSDALEDLGRETSGKLIIKALRAGAKPIVKDYKDNVPVRTGTLKKSIGVAVHKNSDGSKDLLVLAKSGKTRKYNGWYAHLVEFGTVNIEPDSSLRNSISDNSQESIKLTGEKLMELILSEVRKS